MGNPQTMLALMSKIANERTAQDAKWGEQNHPLGTGGILRTAIANASREACDRKAKEGSLTWKDILAEEYHEMLAEHEPERVATEAIQLAAVCIAMVECMARRGELDGWV